MQAQLFTSLIQLFVQNEFCKIRENLHFFGKLKKSKNMLNKCCKFFKMRKSCSNFAQKCSKIEKKKKRFLEYKIRMNFLFLHRKNIANIFLSYSNISTQCFRMRLQMKFKKKIAKKLVGIFPNVLPHFSKWLKINTAKNVLNLL